MKNKGHQEAAQPAAMRPKLVVISASLNPASRSFRLAEAAAEAVTRAGAEATLIDLRKWELPFCDGDASYDHPEVDKLTRLIQQADAILLAAPIYNYDVNAAAKNLIELTGSAWAEKPVGFLCSAGGKSSYMSPIGLANSLMFDFRSWIVPRFVYAAPGDFTEEVSPSPKILERIGQLANAAIDMAKALAWIRNQSAAAEAGAQTG